MGCEKLTKIIKAVKASEAEFSRSMRQFDCKSSVNFADQMKLAIAEYYELYPNLAADFLRLLQNSQTRDGLKEFAKSAALNPAFIEALDDRRQITDKPIRQQDYDRLIANLKEKYRTEENFGYLCQEAIRLFLSVYKEGKPIKIKTRDLPALLAKNFGQLFNGGNIEVDHIYEEAFNQMFSGHVKLQKLGAKHKLFPELGAGMHGGFIEAKEVSGGVGKNMAGGTIVVENLDYGTIASKATGGTVFVKNFFLESKDGFMRQGGSEFCFGATAGTFVIENLGLGQIMIGAAKGATVLVKAKREKISNDSDNPTYQGYDAVIACYDEEKDKFEFVNKAHQIDRNNIYDYRGGQQPYLRLKGIHELHMRDIGDGINDFSFIYGAIVIVRNVGSCRNIGSGMRNGFIIIDDPKISLEEAKSRVSPISEREGGVVLYLRKWTEGKVFKKKKAEFVVI
jgi:hypothetical protein